MLLLKWYVLLSSIKDSPKCFFSMVVVGPLGFAIWHFLAGIRYPPPSSHSSPCPASVWVWGWGEAIAQHTQQETNRLWQQDPQRSNPAALKGISWHVPTLALTKSQAILEKLQDQRTDLYRCIAFRIACSKKWKPGAFRTNSTSAVPRPWARCETPSTLP